MNVKELLAAAVLCTDLGALAGAMPEEKKKGVEMHLHLVIASGYLLEYAKHLADGLEEYDTLLATVRGEMKLPDSPALTTFKLLLPRAGGASDGGEVA